MASFGGPGAHRTDIGNMSSQKVAKRVPPEVSKWGPPPCGTRSGRSRGEDKRRRGRFPHA